MSTPKLPLSLKFYGISPWELEVVYSLLHSLFTVEEYPDTEPEEDFTTMIEITFPLDFNDTFFKWFGMPRWNKLKGILKEIKRRRGSGNSLRVYIKFTGQPSITFIADLNDRNSFDSAIDKIDFVLELIPYHFDPQKIPKSITQVFYQFDEMMGKWNIDYAVAGNETYLYSKNEWKIT